MEVRIRKATEEDIRSVQKLSRELFEFDSSHDPLLNMEWSYSESGREIFLSRISEEGRFCFVAQVDGEIVGYIMGSILGIPPWRPVKRISIENLIINEKFRGKKIGEKLTQKVLDYGKAMGVKRAVVMVYASSETAIKFYEKIGFTPDSLQLEKNLDE